ncbi:MAG: DegT/DnrJ/EryC1/StrS family aminotransferase [Actinobacteria bacterium]|nr:DegT/DnrJ/EryC1/StrS family aminotransferase [Actinomycetota bacterium]
MKVRLFKPCVGKEELNAIKEIFNISWLGLGEKVYEFEKKWSEFIGCKDSIGVTSATAALHLALAAFKFPKGKKVLVPAITFASTATAAHYNDLEPVFVDCNEETLGIDLEDLERKIDKNCVAVMPVHFGGYPVPMDSLMNIARKHNLKVIEDCAHTQGGEYKGKKLGTWGDIGCFSFEEKKGMTTGDGGMISSNNKELIAPLRAMRWVGIDKDTWKRKSGYTQNDSNSKHWYYEISMLGYKYNMNNLAASIGLEQLKKLNWINEAKRKAIGIYLNGIKDIDDIKPLLPYDINTNSSYWIFGVRTENRDDLVLYLKKHGVATSVHFTPLPLHPFWKNHKEPIPISLKVYERILTLPLFPEISRDQIEYIIKILKQFCK